MSTSVSEIATSILSLLEPLTPDERRRVIQGVLVLLGESSPTLPLSAAALPAAQSRPMPGDAKQFFDEKQPTSKLEELAVAARFREISNAAESHSKNDIEAVFRTARRNFDSVHFQRDLDNAKMKGLFNKGGEKGTAVLAYYGQNYVDTLPDRDALKQMRAPKKSGGKKSVKRSSKGGGKPGSKKAKS
jgi:hypothetical protein